MAITSILLNFSFFPLLIVTIYCLFIYRKLSKELRTFAWFIFLSATMELFSRIFWLLHMNNLPFLHLYVAVGFCILALFYKHVLKGFISSALAWTIIMLFLLFTVINSLFIQPIFTFNSYALIVESVLIIIISGYTILLKSGNSIVKIPNWINFGLLLYYSSSLLIFYFGDTLTQVFSKEASVYTWVMHSIASMIMYCCFFVGLWQLKARD